jgi:hypothetical protein
LHERVELPEPVIVVGLRLQLKFAGELAIVVVRTTFAEKPFRGDIVMVDVPPPLTVRDVGFAAMLKYWIV